MEDTMARPTTRTIHLLGVEAMRLDEDGAQTPATTSGTMRKGLAIIHQLQIEGDNLAHNLLVQLQGTDHQGTDHVPSTRTLLTGVMEFLSSG